MREIKAEQEDRSTLAGNGIPDSAQDKEIQEIQQDGAPADGRREDFEKEIRELSVPSPGFFRDEASRSRERDTAKASSTPQTEAELEEEERQEENFYEQRRRERHERIQRRRKRQKRKRILALAVTLAAVFGVAVFFFGDRLGISQGAKNLVAKAGEFFSREIDNGKNPDSGSAVADGENNAGINDDGDGSTADDSQQAFAKAGEGVASQAAAAGAGVIRTEAKRERRLLKRAKAKATQYDYDGAIRILTSDEAYGRSPKLQSTVQKYEKKRDSCVAWEPEQVTHVFFHSLIVDTSKAFDGDYKQDGYNQVMTTLDEFNKIIQTMYDRGYVMVNLYDLALVDENGVMTAQTVYLPEGKTPFVLSQDDACYYHAQQGDGIATKLVLDEDGKVRNEYEEDDGSISVGDYDVVPLIDRFVEEHPDFSYHGHKGIVALTGYDGILGYRTDISYETREDIYDDKIAWLDAHPDFSLEEERAEAKEVADAMKAEGWTFASHTWGHKNMSDVSMERLVTDTQNFKENVDPLIGGTDIIIFAFGADITGIEDYTGDEKFEYLKSQGYNYYCNVDSSKYFVQIRDEYFRMGRRNLDGYRMYYNPEMLEDLFDVSEVFDPSRPTPVPPMGES